MLNKNSIMDTEIKDIDCKVRNKMSIFENVNHKKATRTNR